MWFFFSNILLLSDLYAWHTGKLIHRVHTGIAPNALNRLFVRNDQIHNYGTRNRTNLSIPNHVTSAVHKSILQTGPTIWNNIPIPIRNSYSHVIFKKHFKKHLLNKYADF